MMILNVIHKNAEIFLKNVRPKKITKEKARTTRSCLALWVFSD